MPLTTIQRTFSGKFVRVTSWNATTRKAFLWMRRPVQDVTNAQKWLLPPLKSTGRFSEVMGDDGCGVLALGSANTTCSLLLLSFFGGPKISKSMGSLIESYHELSEVFQGCILFSQNGPFFSFKSFNFMFFVCLFFWVVNRQFVLRWSWNWRCEATLFFDLEMCF